MPISTFMFESPRVPNLQPTSSWHYQTSLIYANLKGIKWYLFCFNDFIYLFLERGEGREKERERNIDVPEKHRLVASHMPWGPGPQPRHVL